MSNFSLLAVATMTVAGASSLVTRTRLAPLTVDKGIAAEASTLITLALFSLAGLLMSWIAITAFHCDLSLALC